jgi:putative membrane protein insertion efficiency factor
MYKVKKIVYHIFLFPIHTYRYLISPILGPRCRFSPSCSEYTIECIQTYGLIKGSLLSIKRILRCRPNGGEGYDPVPKPSSMHNESNEPKKNPKKTPSSH